MVRMLEVAFTPAPTFFPLLALSITGGSSSQQNCYSRGMDESLAHSRFLLPAPIGSLLAPDTTLCPRHGRQAFWADRRLALNAFSKTALVHPAQCGFHVTQQAGLAVHVPNRQISFRRVLNLVHLVRALLDGDAVPVLQYVNQFGLFPFQNRLEPTQADICCLHCRPSSNSSDLILYRPARNGPEQNPAIRSLWATEPARDWRNFTGAGMQRLHLQRGICLHTICKCRLY